MSVEAIAWALKQPITHSSAKFVLVVMANCADGKDFLAWPSTAYLADATGQNRKTVLENMKRLREWGFIEDSGERKGDTGSVVVYRLSEPKNGTASHAEAIPKSEPLTSPENGTPSSLSAVPKTGHLEQSEAVPFSDGSSPKNGMKLSQKRIEAVPKTGHGTVRTVKEPSGNRQYTRESLPLPAWLPAETWDRWDAYRKRKSGKGWTDDARELSLRTLTKLRTEGHDPVAVIEQSIERTWTGLFGLKVARQSEGDRRIADFLADGRPTYHDDGMTFDMEDLR